MLSRAITIGQILESGARLSWRESVALTLSLAALWDAGEPAECDGDLLSGVALEEAGATTALGACPALSVSALALFLVQLLPADTAPVERRAPAGVYLAIGRALDVVEAPPLRTVADFAAALSRYERGSRSVLLRRVYKRCLHGSRASTADGRPRMAVAVPDAANKVVTERRMSGARVDTLRRMIRERDHHDYLVRAGGHANSAAARQPDPDNGPTVDALRRSLREVDRVDFERLPRRASSRARTSRWVVAAGLVAAAATGAGVAEWRHATSNSAVTAPVRLVERQMATASQASPADLLPTNEPTGAADRSVRTTRTVEATTPEALAGGAAITPQSVTRGGVRRPSRRPSQRSASTPARPSAGRRIAAATAPASARAADRPSPRPGVEAAANATGSRRLPQPLRLFATLGRRLSGAFHRDPSPPGTP